MRIADRTLAHRRWCAELQTSIQANLCQSLNGLLMNRRRTCAGKMSRKALKVNATEMVESQKGTLQGEALLTRNTALVRRIALHLLRPRNYVAVDDLIQAGMIGLLEAMRGREQGTAGSFEAYASLRIREAMLDFVRKSDWSLRSVRIGPRSTEDEAKPASRKTLV